jgi:hypothetical protein
MRKYIIDEHTLFTSYDFPAIPMRDLDWSCVDNNYDGAPDAGPQIVGYGRTENEAIEDWLAQYNETKE